MKVFLPLLLSLSLNLNFGLNVTPDQALIEACLNGDPRGIEAALSQGAQLEARHTDRDLTPLMLAIYRDHPALVRLLLARGANPNARNHLGFTPLMMAAAGGQSDIVTLLLDQGAGIDDSDESGHSPLMWAAFWGHIEIVKSLLTRGADPSLSNDDGNTPLLLAALGGTSQQTRQLLNPLRKRLPTGRILPLTLNAKAEAELVALLLARKADPNLRNRAGQSALMLFAGQGKAEPVELLLAQGAERDARDLEGLNAEAYARRAGFIQIAKLLAEKN